MQIGFALITDQSYIDLLVPIANEIGEEFGFRNRLGTTENIPHVTIFQGTFCDDFDYQAALEHAEGKRKSLGISEMLFTGVGYEPQGWYFLNCQNSSGYPFQKLHDAVLDDIEKDIALDPKRMEQDMTGFPGYQREMIKQYGYRYSRMAYRPHITIGRTVDIMNPEILKTVGAKLRGTPAIVPIQKIDVYKMGENGVHAETLAEILIQEG